MEKLLHVPKTLTIGFKNREDTTDGKLAFIIYHDEKGVLRKENSWNGWRDKSIPSIEVPNEPVSGISLNKSIRRYANWGSGRHVLRAYDSRGFEFEITVENLIGILSHGDLIDKEFTGTFVFAWAGAELVLLPTNSDAYQSSLVFTQNKSAKFSAKSLVVGKKYLHKSTNEAITYLGYFPKYVFGGGMPKKHHVFYGSSSFYGCSSNTFVTPAMNTIVGETGEVETNMDAIMSDFSKHLSYQKIVGFETSPIPDGYKGNVFRVKELPNDNWQVDVFWFDHRVYVPHSSVDAGLVNHMCHAPTFGQFKGWCHVYNVKFNTTTGAREKMVNGRDCTGYGTIDLADFKLLSYKFENGETDPVYF